MGKATIVVGAIVAIKAAYDHFNVTLDEQIEKFNEAKSVYDSAKSELEGIESQLKSVRDRIDEINSQENLSITDETQLRLLQEEEASLENQVLLQQELVKAAREEATLEAERTLTKTFKSGEVFGYSTPTHEDPLLKEHSGTVLDAVSIYTQKINEEQDAIDSLLEQRQQLRDAGREESSIYNTLGAQIEEHITKRDDLRISASEYVQTTQDVVTGANAENEIVKEGNMLLDGYYATLRRITGEEQELQEETKNTGDAIQYTDEQIQEYADDMGISFEEAAEALGVVTDNGEDATGSLEDLAKSVGLSAGELLEFANALGVSAEKAAEIQSLNNEWNESVDNIQSAYEILTGAIEEYNEQGYYNIDTLQSLLALSPEYLGMIQEEGNQLSLNEEALRNKVIAQAEEAKQIAYNTALTRLNAIAAGEAATATEEAGNSSNNAVADHNDNAQAIYNETAAYTTLYTAAARARGMGGSREDIQQVLDDYTTQIETINRWADNIGKNFEGSIGAATKSTKGTTKAVEETTEELEDQESELDKLKDKYKDVISFILKQYDKQIDKIKEIKETAIKSVESQIDAIEKEKDSRLKAIDSEIEALQRQRDAREKYWQDQLDKLEKENNERQRNIELQEKQQALALAQQTQVMIMKGGQFVYGQDEGAVAGAEQDLAEQEDQNEYERQKELIEELRDAELEWYDERIQALEDYKERVQEYYENQIEQLEEYQEYLEEYYESQIESLEEQKEAVDEILEAGVASQQEYWDSMIAQLSSFIEEWNALVGKLSFPNISGSGLSVGSILGKSTGDNKVGISAYASGKGSVGDSEIAVVGENPKYRELVIGSKLNNDQGVVMNLKRGSGVVNAGATNTLASIFNSLNGQKSVGQPVSNSNQSMSIQIGSISLPEVKDGQGFVDYLQNFSADITQQSFRRV